MRPQKAYIMRHDSDISREYSETCAESCEKVGLEYEFWEGFCNMSNYEIWDALKLFDYDTKKITLFEAYTQRAKSNACTANHLNIWKHITEQKEEAVIILEHDAVMLHSVDIDIPDGFFVALGYRISNPEHYKYNEVGPPKEIVSISKHAGSHAYAITKKTASNILYEIKEWNIPVGCIDNHWFNNTSRKTKTKVAITDPIAAVAWLRESTIQSSSALSNINPIKSFKQNLKK